MKPIYMCLALVLTACAAPPTEDLILEPITEDNLFDPSTAGPPPSELSDKERLVAAIEAEGCVLNAANSERVFSALGIAEDRIGQIGAELAQEGRVDVSNPGEFRLTTGACAT